MDPLENAEPHIKLAVDLIMLLEENNIEPGVVLQALPIIEMDYRNKQLYQENMPKN